MYEKLEVDFCQGGIIDSGFNLLPVSESLLPRVIVLSREYDIYNAETELVEELAPATKAPHVVLDFSAVRYIDSSGITVLVRTQKQRTAEGLPQLHLASLQPNVRYVFELVSLDRFLRIFHTVPQAVAAFGVDC